MIDLLVAFIVALIIIGFLFWAIEKILPLIPMPAEFRSFIKVAIEIAIVAVVVFYFAIPLIKMLPHYLHF